MYISNDYGLWCLSTLVFMGFIDQLGYAEYMANQPDTLQNK